MPVIKRILETALYVKNLKTASKFYEDIMGFVVITRDDRLSSFDVAGQSILLLFTIDGSTEGAETHGGDYIPPHNASGQQHLAFEIEKDEIEAWRRHLTAADVEILSHTTWSRGGQSFYFHDPDGHLLELVGTPGTWPGH